MNCQDFLGRYSEYVDGLLAPVETAMFHDHVIECDRCARYDQVMQRGLELARAIPTVEPSSDFQLRLQHRLMHVRDDMGTVGTSDGVRIGSAAAVSVAVAGLLALAAWGPLWRGAGSDGETAQLDRTVEAAGMSMPLPYSDVRPVAGESAWWAPASLTTPPRPITGAFPGPYSPLIVTTPTGDYQAGVVRAVLSSYSGLD
jgi:anti-sigma factor RsiW